MSLVPESLHRLLCERLCREVGVAIRPDGSVMLETPVGAAPTRPLAGRRISA